MNFARGEVLLPTRVPRLVKNNTFLGHSGVYFPKCVMIEVIKTSLSHLDIQNKKNIVLSQTSNSIFFFINFKVYTIKMTDVKKLS